LAKSKGEGSKRGEKRWVPPGPEKSPKKAAEQDYPEPERPITPDEELGVDIEELEHPPQAEGPREED